MKFQKIYLLVSFLIVAVSCEKMEKENTSFSVDGTINSIASGKAYLIRKNLEDGLSISDTLDVTEIIDHKFNFTGEARGPFPAYILIANSNNELHSQNVFILENAALEVEMENKILYPNNVRGGNYWHQIIYSVSKIHPEYRKTNGGVMYWQMMKELKALNFDQEIIDKIDTKRIAALDTASAVGKRIRKETYEKSKDTMFKLLYSYRLGGRAIDDNEYSSVLNKSENRYGKDYYLVQLLKQMHDKNIAIKKVKQSIAIGKPFKNIVGKTIAGKELELAEVVRTNKVILLDFWASWCSPCIAEIPHLKKVYEKYHEKGFEIYGFSVDKKEENWIKMLEKQNLPWINTIDLAGWKSKGAKSYAVQAIPTGFLIVDGKIAATDYEVKGKKLDQKLIAIFGQ